MPLEQMTCRPLAAGTLPLPHREAERLLPEIPGWNLAGEELVRELTFKDFRQAMVFVNRVADLAESEAHHPDMHVSYNRVRLVLRTHKINGLSLNDFILAAKVNRLPGLPAATAAHG